MQSTTIAMDVHKSVFEIAVSEVPGKIKQRKRLTRGRLLEFLSQQPKATVVMEACGSSHYWGRQVRELGHDPVLLPPSEVKRYVRRQKTDKRDTKGLLEAIRNEEILPVPVKSVEQQGLCALHGYRSSWMKTRVAQINMIRGVLREFGLLIPQGATKVVPRVRLYLAEAESSIPEMLRATLEEACSEILDLEQRIKGVEAQLRALSKQISAIQDLMSVPGIGLLTATALYAFIGDFGRFPTGRHLSSFVGITAREHQSGNRRRMGGISKQGNRYLRTLLIHGARSLLAAARRNPGEDRLRQWAVRVYERRGHNRAVVALANKLARIAWAVSREKRRYRTLVA